MSAPLDRPSTTGARLGRTSVAVFAPFAFAFFLIFFFRTSNAVIAPNLVADLSLSAADLGFLTALYFLAFAGMQIPIGILLDRFGPRRVQAALLLVCALGAAVFGLSESKAWLGLGRALLGLGAAAGLMAGLKSIAQWFPRERLPVVNSIYFAVGGLGALAATVPLEAFLAYGTWRELYLIIGALTLASAIAIYALVPDADQATEIKDLTGQIADYAAILRDRLFRRAVPLFTMVAGVTMAVQSLWAGPWLRDVAGLDRAHVANYLAYMMLAIVVGQLCGGLIADFGRRLGLRVASVIAVGTGLYLCVTLAIILEATGLGRLLWMSYAFFASAGSLTFALLAQHFPPAVIGRANATANVCVVLGAFLVQSFIGFVLDLRPTLAEGGYHPQGYQIAFLALFGGQALAYAWFLMGRRRGDLA